MCSFNPSEKRAFARFYSSPRSTTEPAVSGFHAIRTDLPLTAVLSPVSSTQASTSFFFFFFFNQCRLPPSYIVSPIYRLHAPICTKFFLNRQITLRLGRPREVWDDDRIPTAKASRFLSRPPPRQSPQESPPEFIPNPPFLSPFTLSRSRNNQLSPSQLHALLFPPTSRLSELKNCIGKWAPKWA